MFSRFTKQSSKTPHERLRRKSGGVSRDLPDADSTYGNLEGAA